MLTKHLYDLSDDLVLKSLRGAVALNPLLGLHEPSKTVFVLPSPSSSTSLDPASSSSAASSTAPHKPTPRRVAVISGGSSGHETAQAGYTDRGALAASEAGDIFANPSAKQVLYAIQLGAFGGTGSAHEENPRDVLTIINNYTGNMLDFGLAVEKA